MKITIDLTPSQAELLGQEAVGHLLAEETGHVERRLWRKIHDALKDTPLVRETRCLTQPWHGRCGRCSDVKRLTTRGPYQSALCDDCAGAVEHEATNGVR